MAAIYVRISRDPMETGAGVARQEKDCRAMLASAGHQSPVLYSDNNRSAWKRDRRRPGWDALLRDIEGGVIDVLAVWHPDRLIRQPFDLERLIQIAEGGLPFLSAGGGRDLGDADDRFVLRIETAAACRASDDASRRLRRAFVDKAKSGTAHGGPRPFGLAPNRVDQDPAEVDAIREISRRLLSGESLRSVTAWINTTGLTPTSRKATTWSPPTIKQMLSRPSIAGQRVHRGEVVGQTADAAAHGPILDEDTWTAVKALLSDPERRKTTTSARQHLLSGIARCGLCASAMRRHQVEGRNRYLCSTCNKVAIVQEKTETVVVAAVLDYIRSTPKITERRGIGLDGVGVQIMALVERQVELRRLAAEPDAPPMTEIFSMWRNIESRLAALRAQQEASLDARIANSVDDSVADRWHDLSVDRRRSIIKAVIERLVILPANGVNYFDPTRIDLVFRPQQH